MMNDIIKEVREAKQKVSEKYGNDIHKYCVDVRRRQEKLKKQGVKFLCLSEKQKSIVDEA